MNRSHLLLAGAALAALFTACQNPKPDPVRPAPSNTKSDTAQNPKAPPKQAEKPMAKAVNAAKGKKVTGNCPPNSEYPGDGLKSLVDGMMGTDDYYDAEWLGWWYEDKPFDVTIDLGAKKNIVELGVHALSVSEAWILYPKKIEFELSDDGKAFRKMTVVTPSKEDLETEDPEEQTFKLSGLSESARYVRVKVQRYGELPEWHNAHGGADGYDGEAWLFVDEILVMAK